MESSGNHWNVTLWSDYLDGNRSVDGANAEVSRCPESFRFVINTVLAGSLCTLGFTGNTISFLVLSRDKEAHVAAFLLKTLAVVDNFFLCIWFLHFSLSNSFTYMQIYHTFHISWLYIRVYTYPLLFVGQTGTIWMVVLIAVSRYVAVCKPYRAAEYSSMRTLQKAAALVLTVAILYNIPRFFETRIVSMENNGTTFYNLERTAFGDTLTYGLLYFDSLYYIFSFILPLVMLTFLNTKLTLAYRRVQKRRQSLRSCHDSHENNITLVMIVVILVFVLCNAPARITQIIWGYRPQSCLSTGFVMMELSNVLEVFNSSTNFIVYCVFRSQFRSILKQKLCHVGRQTPDIAITECFPNGRSIGTCTANHVTLCTALASDITPDGRSGAHSEQV